MNAMSDKNTGFGRTEQEILSFEVSDESLEIAAGTEKAGIYTLGYCTGLSACPA
jgi:hypothetical protein